MGRAREPGDWDRDRAAARPLERRVHAALAAHPAISHLANFTDETDGLDFRFKFERAEVHVDLKAKHRRLSEDVAAQWPELPRDELFVVDETAFRQLVWTEGLGYLLVADEPRSRWHVFGPWELCLGPRRRFERRGTKTKVEFLKGKLLLDLRTASRTTDDLSVDALLDVVRSSRRALRSVRAVKIAGQHELPVLPQRTPRPPAESEVAPADQKVETSPQPALDPTWEGLSGELVAKIRTKLGWDAPTDAQRAAFPPILNGRNALVVAPTAGGKTEAALLPLLDRYRQQGWGSTRPSIVGISPLKALLDDQLERWRTLLALVGGTAFAWHGDVGHDVKRSFKDDPDDALLTTPESLELLLTSGRHDERALLGGVQAVVIDEVHALVGTPRGAQLASLLERLFQFAGADFQRIGLSATVGSPDAVLDWVRGASLREHEVVVATRQMQGEDVSIRTYESESEALDAASTATAGRRAIVFTPSRRRAEQLAHLMGVPVHHSSISAEDRDSAVRALRTGSAPSIVATASLEMGVDIGDLDLVVHDGAPSSPSSYLQRAGRAGRKTGERRVVFTVGEADDLLVVLAILAQSRRGDLGATHPQRGARLVLGQQAIAVTQQLFITDRHALHDTLRWSPTFAGLDADIEATIDHLLAHRWLHPDGDRIVLGPEGQARFGGPGLNELLATFQTPPSVTVVDENGRRIGSVDWTRASDEDSGRAITDLVLSGRSWTVVGLDRQKAVLTVRPGGKGKAPSWRGPALEIERPTWEAVRDVLSNTEVPTDLDARALRWLQERRGSWTSRLKTPVRTTDEGTVVDSFCGVQVHRAALAALEVDGYAEGASCQLNAALPVLATRARTLLDEYDAVLEEEAARVATQLKPRHPELVAPSVLLAEARRFHVDSDGLHQFLTLLAGA